MIALLLLAMAADASTARSHAAGLATATILEGRRIHLIEQAIEPGAVPLPRVQHTRTIRRSGTGRPVEVRLLEFQ